MTRMLIYYILTSTMYPIAAKVLALIQSGQNAFVGTDLLHLKNRFLFALRDKPLPPKELCAVLKQDKTNIAHLAADLVMCGLIEKQLHKTDKRRIRYALTETGREKIDAALALADSALAKIIDGEAAAICAQEQIEGLLRLFSFL